MSTIGVAGKFLTDKQMMKLSEVFKMSDPIAAMFQKMYQDEIEKKDSEMAKIAKKLEQKDFEIEQKNFEIAKNLLAENLDFSIIARTTNLSLDTIKDLQLKL